MSDDLLAPSPWVAHAPPEEIVGDGLILHRVRPDHAAPLVDAVRASLPELQPFMPWAVPDYGPAEAATFLDAAATGWAQRSDFPYVIADAQHDGAVVGTIGLIARIGPGALELGYWVATPHTGRHTARRAAALLIDACRSMPEVRAVEIHHVPDNHASRTIPLQLGFTLVGEREFPPGGPHPAGQFVVWRLPVD